MRALPRYLSMRDMANKLGAAFLRCAVGPLNYAGGCILAGKVADGLRELSADSLHGGVRRGIEEAAKQVGVGILDVERLLPMLDVQNAAERLDAAQRGAVAAWETHAGQIGGLLKGVADLTVDGRAPDVSNFLERLSKKVVRDVPLSEPLHKLSVEVACWLDLVEKCGDLLADGGALATAYRRRRIRRTVLAGGGGLVVVLALSIVIELRVVRVRVDAALTAADPCAALSIDSGDLSRASSAQRRRAQERRASCEEQRLRDEKAREEQRLRDEKAREDDRLRQERRARCDGLATRLGGGAVLPDDEALAPGKLALLRRIAQRSLDRGDLGDLDLPCAGTPAGDAIAATFAAALVGSPAAWANADDVCDRARAILVEHQAELPAAAKQHLVTHADNLVKRAMIQRSAATFERAERVCKLKDDLGLRGAAYCASLSAVRAAGKQ